MMFTGKLWGQEGSGEWKGKGIVYLSQTCPVTESQIISTEAVDTENSNANARKSIKMVKKGKTQNPRVQWPPTSELLKHFST